MTDDELDTCPDDAFDDVTIDPDMVDLVAMFLHAKRAEVHALSEALARRDFRRLRTAGHNLSGSGGAYGFPRLSSLGSALASAGRGEDVAAARDTLSSLSAYLTAWTRRYG